MNYSFTFLLFISVIDHNNITILFEFNSDAAGQVAGAAGQVAGSAGQVAGAVTGAVTGMLSCYNSENKYNIITYYSLKRIILVKCSGIVPKMLS